MMELRLVPDFAGWFRWFFHGYEAYRDSLEAAPGLEPRFMGVLPYNNWLFFFIVIIPAAVFNTLVIWRWVTGMREPRWVQKAPGAVQHPSWLSMIRGTTVEAVKTGDMCRKCVWCTRGRRVDDVCVGMSNVSVPVSLWARGWLLAVHSSFLPLVPTCHYM